MVKVAEVTAHAMYFRVFTLSLSPSGDGAGGRPGGRPGEPGGPGGAGGPQGPKGTSVPSKNVKVGGDG